MNQFKRPLFSAVINIHREGRWAARAVRSAVVGIQALLKEREGETAEIVVIADKHDADTYECVRVALLEAIGGDVRISPQMLPVELGDLGLSRNFGVRHADGRIIAFLDGDDVWGAAWPKLGVAAIEATPNGPLVAAHPRTNVDFGDGAFWWTQPDQRSDDFDPATFWTTNCWSSGVMTTREVLLTHHYKPRTQGLGFEDWEWNARTVAAGVLHVSVPGAVVFIRKKNDGLNADSAKKRQVVAHSEYFETLPEMLPRHKGVEMLPELPDEHERILSQWRAINKIEPALWPDVREVQHLPRYKASPDRAVPNLVRLMLKLVTQTPTHVIVAPCLVRGGADKRVLMYARAVARTGGRPLVLLADRDSDPTQTKSLPEDIQVVDCAKIFSAAGAGASIQALLRLLMRWRSKLHVVNSQLGYALIKNFGASLKDAGVPRVFCSLYGSEPQAGRLGGAGFNGWFESASAHIDCVISDNQKHLDELASVSSWPQKKTQVVKSVVEPLPPEVFASYRQAREQSNVPLIRVLWASRMVKGKRLDFVARLAKHAHENKLRLAFSIAGTPGDYFGREALASLRGLPNVKIADKAFDGWRALVPEKHDVFLFTSESEGMPNVVLEALANGLPVVSSPAGDVPTLPRECVSVCELSDPLEKWAESIYAACAAFRPEIAQKHLQENHTQHAFEMALRAADYITKEST